MITYRRSSGSGQNLILPGTSLTQWRLRSRWCAAVDVLTVLAAAALIIFTAIDTMTSWPSNQVLVGDPDVARFAAIVLAPCWPWLLVSAVMVYGVPRRESVTADPERPRSPLWPWPWRAGMTLAGLVSLVVVVGAFVIGADSGTTRVLPGRRYEVSALDLHNAGWTMVSPAQFHFWQASFLREDAVFTMFAVALIAGSLGFLHRHRQLVRR